MLSTKDVTTVQMGNMQIPMNLNGRKTEQVPSTFGQQGNDFI
jgi:hypothetical protein